MPAADKCAHALDAVREILCDPSKPTFVFAKDQIDKISTVTVGNYTLGYVLASGFLELPATDEDQARAMAVGIGPCIPESTTLREVLVRDALCRVPSVLETLPKVAPDYLANQGGPSSEQSAFELVVSLTLAREEFPSCVAAPQFSSQPLADFLANLSQRPPNTAMICFPDTFAGPNVVIAGDVPGAGPEPALKVLWVQAKLAGALWEGACARPQGNRPDHDLSPVGGRQGD